MPSPARLLAFALVVAAGGTAHAQLRDCRPAQDAPYFVFLNEPRFTANAFKNRQAMLEVFNRLHQHLDERADREMAGLREVRFHVARCENRIPAVDGADFTDDLVRSLHGRKVVVEIWGTFDRRGGGPAAQINYLLVPIRHGVVEGSKNVSAMHRFDYPDRQIVASDFVDLVSNADLHAFVASAIGVGAFDNNELALAHQMLCRAVSQLARTADRLAAEPLTQPRSQRIRELNGFLIALAGESIVAGRKQNPQPDFAQLQNPENPCPGP